MNCKDFRELADSYLSDELAVETNHEVFSHLGNCAACRQILTARRELKEKLQNSFRNSPEFQIDPVFTVELKEKLHEEFLGKKSWFDWKVFVPVFASFLIMITLGFALLYEREPTDVSMQKYLVEMSQKAIGDHKYCALDKIKEWETDARQVSAEKAVFVKPLQDGNTEIIEAHDCIFEGKIFTHYILRRDEKIVSVLKIASENSSQTNAKLGDSIISEREDGLQMAKFQNEESLIFVISDMTETENLSLARTLSDSLRSNV